MKRSTYNVLQMVASFTVFMIILINITLFLYMFFYRSALIQEQEILSDSDPQICFYGALMVYSNLFLCFISSYAFNVRYKFVMNISILFSIIINGIGIYSIIVFIRDNMKTLSIRMMTISNNEIKSNLLVYTKETSFENAKLIFQAVYGDVIKIYTLMEGVCIFGFTLLLIGILTTKYTEIEEEQGKPTIRKTTVEIPCRQPNSFRACLGVKA